MDTDWNRSQKSIKENIKEWLSEQKSDLIFARSKGEMDLPVWKKINVNNTSRKFLSRQLAERDF